MMGKAAGYASTASSRGPTAEAVAADLLEQLGADVQVVMFFASSTFDFPVVAAAIHQTFEGALTIGCTTAGELGPQGCAEDSVTALALGRPARCAARLIDLGNFQFGDGNELVRGLGKDLGVANLDPQKHLFLTLTDGLSGMEETVIAALHTWAPELSLVGGSAADDHRFEATWVAVNGVARIKAAVVLALEPGVAFHAFLLHHYQPTDKRVVVTASDPEHRMIHELNGWPATKVLADILGISDEDIHRPESFQISFGFDVGGTWFLRAVLERQGTSLRMGGAVEEGAVLQVMEPGDMVSETRLGVARAVAQVPGPAQALLLFNCAGRMIEAANTSCIGDLGRAMAPLRSVGFTTYGEQYGPMTVNHTLTGLVLGSR